MKLLPGYVAGLPEHLTCIDTECGYIWNPRGIEIGYDIGSLAGPGLTPEPNKAMDYVWYGEAKINGQIVRYGLSAEEKPYSLTVSFPASYANFDADVRREADIRTVLEMVLTYEGIDYSPNPASFMDLLFAKRGGTRVAGIEVALRDFGTGRFQTARTDSEGHVRFPDVLPGRYQLSVTSDDGGCPSEGRRWKITMKPAEILLRSFALSCR